jgi:transketolase
VAIALAARDALQADGIATAVVSMPSWDLFADQDAAYQASVLGAGTVRVGCEAAMRFGWDRWLWAHGSAGADFVGMPGFGASGPAEALYRHFGITAEAVAGAARRLMAAG